MQICLPPETLYGLSVIIWNHVSQAFHFSCVSGAGAPSWGSYQLSPIIALFQIAWKPQVITQPSSCSRETNTSQPSLLQTESTASQKEIKAVAGSTPKLGIYRCSIKPIDNTPKPLHWAGKALIQLGSKWVHSEERNKNHGCSRCASYKGRRRAQTAASFKNSNFSIHHGLLLNFRILALPLKHSLL